MKSTMTTRLTSAERILRIVCAALMLSLGFAHKPVNATPVAIQQDEAYRLPDGTFADICSDHAAGASTVDGHGLPAHSDVATALFCEACLLASSILVPVPDENSWLRTRFVWLSNDLRSEGTIQKIHHTERAKARAPPVSA